MTTRAKPKHRREIIRPMLIGTIMGVILALTFAAGFVLRDIIGVSSVTGLVTVRADSEGYPLLDEVQNLIDQIFLREQPDYSIRQYAAIRGLLSVLDDEHTFFIEPPVAQSEADALAGTYGGIGVQLQRGETGDFILYPYPDGPAAAAGIADGDVLLAINGIAVNLNDQLDAVDQQMRGEVKDGDGVELNVRAVGGNELTVFIEFSVINVPSVIWRLLPDDERVGYLQILRFTNRTPDEVRDALRALNAESVDALILDLRGNSGGLLQESVEVAGEFLDGGVVAYEVSRGDEETFMAGVGGLGIDQELAVLVNGRTASASELVAGAIGDRDRGILVGQMTFGKGTVQQIFSLSDSSSVHITSAEWFTPARRPLDGTGIEPDIAMIPDENGRDIETGQALRYLQQQLDHEVVLDETP